MVCGLLFALLGFTTRMAPEVLWPLGGRDILRDESGKASCRENSSNVGWFAYMGSVPCGRFAPKTEGIILSEIRFGQQAYGCNS
jgi:hypothetical protein